MAFDCVILDFDGTFTDVEQEAVPFLAAYRDDLTRELGPDKTATWDEVRVHIRENANDYGWVFEGRIVAPSNADPYVMATSVAQKLLDDLGILPDPRERRDFLERIFAANYPKAASVFRPEAKRVVENMLAADVQLYVVTNSHTEAVTRKLDELAPAGRERLHIHGDAQKYVIAVPERAPDGLRHVPETQRLEGLDRPIYLHRGHYYDRLSAIREETGVPPERTLVCGDIYELDLALPAALGYAVHLVARPGTPAYERTAVAGLARGGVSDTLGPVADRLTDS